MKKVFFLLIFAAVSFFLFSCDEKKEDDVYNTGDGENTQTVSNPKFSKQSGVYQEELSVEITTETKDASIYFTVDGTNPDDKSTLYSEPVNIPLETTATIKAIAYKDKLKPSAVVSSNYEVTGVLDKPEFNITPGVYTEPQSISLSHSDPEVIIRYTTDGTDPSSKSKTYSIPFSLVNESSTEIKAKAFKTKWGDSSTAQGLFVITGTVISPEFATEPGTYTEAKTITITCENPEAEIRYEVYNEDGGADPTETSTLYTQPFLVPLDTTVVVKAKAFIPGWNPSPAITGKFVITGTVDLPVFSPIEGTYTSEQSVTISVPTEGAVVRYTVDGSDPTELSPLHSTPIVVPLNTQLLIKAKGFKKDWNPSPAVGGNYTVTGKVAAPAFSIIPNYYTSAQSVAITSTTQGASIKFTIDGSEPTKTHGNEYTGAVPIASTTTLKAIAYKTDWIDSNISEGIYNITGQVPAPVFSPVQGNYTNAQTVSLESNIPGITIRYTTDGSSPSRTAGTIYSGSFTVSSTTTVKAFAYRNDWETSSDSAVSNAVYTITGRVSTPKFSVEPGNYTLTKTVALSTETTGAVIRYTVDGSDPSRTAGTIYSAGIVVDKPLTIKAVAYKSDWEESSNSEIATGSYNITGKVFAPEISPVEANHTNNVEVTLSSITSGAKIKYTTNGDTPTRIVGTLYTAPFSISTGSTVKAVAYKDDWEESSNSDISSRAYVITGKVINPKFDILPGNYTTGKTVKITTETTGAVIRYTTDGSTPSRTNGTVYVTTGIVVASTTTIKAIAYRTDWQESSDSTVITGLYTITGTVYAPVATPAEQNHTASVEVSLASITEGAVIRYTTDGTTNPTRVVGTLYENPFTVSATTTVKAIAYKPDWEETSNSTITSKVYTITGKVEKPKLSVEPGNYTTTVSLTLSCDTTGASMRYTIDGSDPTRTTGTLYTAAISIPATRTIKVIAYKTDWQESSNSDIVSALYTITGKAATPVMSPVAGNYTNSTAVAITSDTAGAKIRYTTTGVNPTRSTGTLYTAPVQIDATATLKAIAYKDDWQSTSDSDVASGLYTITGKVVNPKFDIAPGNYTTGKTVKITTETTGVVIRYTLDGTTPTRTNGTIYVTTGIVVSQTTTIKAIAYRTDWQESSDSAVITGLYTITGTVYAPTATPTEQNHTASVEVSLASITEGAVIRYTTDGTTNPTRVVGTLYENPFTVSATTTVKAIAYKPDWEETSNSTITSKVYTITGKVEKPKLSIEPGNYTTTVSLTLSCDTTGAAMRYTIDGSDPTRTTGTLYTAAISIPATRTIKVIAYKTDWQESSNSDIVSGLYTITGKAATPVMSPVAGNYTNSTAVAITSDTAGAKIRYTTTGVNPTRSTGTLYTAPVQIDATATLKAIAYKDDWQSTSDSDVASGLYTITGKVANPIITPQTGFYMSTQSVTITCATSGAKIKYTTNGSDPSEINGFLYTGAFSVASTSTVKAFAYREDWQMSSDSDIISETLTITGKVAAPSFSPAGGKFTDGKYITITSATQDISGDVVIRYSLDGSTPTRSSTLYTEPVFIGETKTLKAIAYVPQWEAASDSNVSTASYVITGIVPAPTITPNGGSGVNSISITITSVLGATIKYTIDGSDPSFTSGLTYTAEINLNTSSTIKAMAYVADQERSSDSPVASATFTVTGNVATPVFSPTPVTNPDTTPTTPVFVTISCPTPGATIRYTTDGTNPSPTSGTIYATGETITFPQPWTLKAIAYKTDWTDSPIASAIYKMKVKTPTFSPGAGTYNTFRSVQIVTETPDVTIRYTTDGSAPETSSNLYAGPVLISATTTLKAIAYKNGGGEMWAPSAIKSEIYTMKAGTPVFSVEPGIYTKTQTVEISTVTEDPVEIRYGYEGEFPVLDCEVIPEDPLNPEPGGSHIFIFNPIDPATFPVVNKTKTIKAIVCKNNWNPSAIAQTQIIMKGATPVISPATGTYAFPQEISITTESDEANIYYTTNGVEPTVDNGTLYSGSFSINEPTVVKAVVLNTYRIASEISTEVFFGTTVPETTVRAEDGNIQAAIDTAAIPSIINITCDAPPCQINETINMKNGVSLKGTSAEEIIIQGTLSNGIGINFPATVRSTTFIENLTVKGGGGTTETRGIYIASGASPTVRNCIIEGGNGSSRSYGIFNNGLSPQIYNNEIYGGYGADSYAIYNENSTRPLIKENYIYGGDNDQSFGIFNMNSAPLIISSAPLIISNEIESGNSTISYSIYNNTGSNNTRVTGNDIKGCSDNSLCSESYSIYVHDNMTIYISNNLIYGGDSSVSSYGIYNKSKDLVVSNNTISGGSAPLAVTIYNEKDPGSSDSLDIKIKNNILYTENSSSGTFCLYELNSKSYFTNVKNNDFFQCQTKLLKDGTSYIVNITSVNSYDGMSGNISSDPFFTGLKPYQPSLQNGLNLYNDHYFPINSSGEPVDIEGTIRSSDFLSDPWWIGAYEMN